LYQSNTDHLLLIQASRALKEAADVIQSNPVALQLRHLQALNSIAYVWSVYCFRFD
jgi:hypothetical protein